MIVLVIQGGTLQTVYGVPSPGLNFKGDEIWVVDWDNIASGDTGVRVDPFHTQSLPPEIAAQIPGWPAG